MKVTQDLTVDLLIAFTMAPNKNIKNRGPKGGLTTAATTKSTQPSIRIIQVNVNRSREAMDLMHQTIQEEKIDITMVSEPNKKIVSRGR